MTEPTYRVSIEQMQPRPIAAVRTRMPLARVPSQFSQYLNQVYAASRAGGVALDGQNIFVYRNVADGEADIDFGVGTRAPFTPVGAVEPTETPGGRAATTTHWGDYRGLGGAHSAVVDWCKAHGHSFAGPSWEVYGHWSDDPAKVRTDIYYLLKATN
jgi:effector-binding domain-containing protein